MAKIDNRAWYDAVVRNRRRMDQLHERLETPMQRRFRGWWPVLGLLGLAIIVLLLVMVA